MKIDNFMSPGRDLFDRKYPIKIKFKNGKSVYGHVVALISSSDVGQTTKIKFQLIKDIDDYCKNITEPSPETILFEDSLIEEISNYKCDECYFHQLEYDRWSLNSPVNSINGANAPVLNEKEKELIDKVNAKFILDIGCGNGKRLFSFLQEKQINFIGIEKFERLVKNSQFENKIIISDLLSLNIDDFISQHKDIDTITILGGSLLGVFCLENQIQAWKKISQIIPSGGKIIFDSLIIYGFESASHIGSKTINPNFPPQYFIAEKQLKEIWENLSLKIIEYSDFRINTSLNIRYYILQKS